MTFGRVQVSKLPAFFLLVGYMRGFYRPGTKIKNNSKTIFSYPFLKVIQNL